MARELYRTHQINAEKGHQYRIEAEGRVVFVWYSYATGLTTCQDQRLKKWKVAALVFGSFSLGTVAAMVQRIFM